MNKKQKFLYFSLGLFTAIAALIIIGILKRVLVKNEAEFISPKWNFCKNNNLLTATVPDYNNTEITVGIELDVESGIVKEIGVVTEPKGRLFGAFLYRPKGQQGVPMCYYGNTNSGIVWRDLNADSNFDQRLNYVEEFMEINVQGKWLIGKGIEKVYTDEGVFVFEGTSGTWKMADELLKGRKEPTENKQKQ